MEFGFGFSKSGFWVIWEMERGSGERGDGVVEGEEIDKRWRE